MIKIYNTYHVGKNALIDESVIIGYPTTDVMKQAFEKNLNELNFTSTIIGDNPVIRSNSVIYIDVKIGNNFKTGHNVVIRENTIIGNNVLVGTNTIIDGHTTIGNNVSIQGNVYIPSNVTIEDNVFIGPSVVMTNDKYPVRKKSTLKGVIIHSYVSIGANSTLLPNIEIGEGSFVAAGALVTKDVSPWKLAIGFPAIIKDLPEELRILNKINKHD